MHNSYYIRLNLVEPIFFAISLSTNFITLPVEVLGNSSLNDTVLGTIYLGIFFLQYSINSPSVGFRVKPGFKLTNAHGVSPQNSSGLATTATSFTAGFVYRTASTSTLLTFSPPVMIISFDLSLISKYPSE
ncbi:hypothetical protein BRARA_C00719 [Brassica rapa]|uniref:Uncharacterized protein n=1 Tax=Brassica campestris TaxID=3711 RepID=A0A397ZSU5_BRACM|nr:hypothetical protein BRARA_C00719 [Brassica rapa]